MTPEVFQPVLENRCIGHEQRIILQRHAADFRQAAARLRRTIRETMLKNGLFTDNPESKHTTLHSCIFPALWGVAEESEKPAILKLMQSKGMACSVFGAQFLLECCCEHLHHLSIQCLHCNTHERHLQRGLRGLSHPCAQVCCLGCH